MNESWKQIEGYEGCFISNFGNISTEYSRKELGGHLPLEISSSGYKWCTLFHGISSYKSHTIHELVAKYFIGEPNFINAEVNHIDTNKLNNHVDNLEWCTHEENMIHYHHLNKMRKIRKIKAAFKLK